MCEGKRQRKQLSQGEVKSWSKDGFIHQESEEK